jgi:cell division protein FtsQ
VSGGPRVVSAEPRLEERARAQRRGRRATALRRAGWVAAALAPVALAAWLLLGSPWLVVDRVVVQGQQRLSVEQVLTAAQVDEGTPLARVDTDAVAARVRALGPVASVTVSRAWPRTLRVTVVERVPVVAVAQGSAFALLDAEGVVVARAPQVPAGVIRLVVAHPGPQDRATTSALTVLQGLPKPIRGLVAALRAPTAEQVTLVLKDRRVVVWGSVADGEAKAAVLVPLLRMKGSVFDVTSPDVVTRR